MTELQNRSTELFNSPLEIGLRKRELIKNGLTLMASKQLVEFDFTKNGISYKATDLTSEFLKYLNSDYALQLSSVAKWLVNNFEEYNDDKLETYIKLHMDVWGGEFTKESLLRGQTQL